MPDKLGRQVSYQAGPSSLSCSAPSVPARVKRQQEYAHPGVYGLVAVVPPIFHRYERVVLSDVDEHPCETGREGRLPCPFLPI